MCIQKYIFFLPYALCPVHCIALHNNLSWTKYNKIPSKDMVLKKVLKYLRVTKKIFLCNIKSLHQYKNLCVFFVSAYCNYYIMKLKSNFCSSF